MRRRHESQEMSDSLTQPQTGSMKLKWKMTPLLLIWAPTVSAQSSLSDPSTTLSSLDDWLRLCTHNHIHPLPCTQSNQAKSIFTLETSRIKNSVIDLCIIFFWLWYQYHYVSFSLTELNPKKKCLWNPGPSSLHHSRKRTEGWRTMFTATDIIQISVTQKL